MTSSLVALQLLAQAADALSLGDDVTRQVRESCVILNTTETLLPQFVMRSINPCKGYANGHEQCSCQWLTIAQECM